MAKGMGTFKVANGGVTLSRRGAGVLLNVSFKEIEIWAAKIQAPVKKLWVRSYGRAVKALRTKLVQVMKHSGGVNGVPKFRDFEQFTKELRDAKNKTAPMGGILADPDYIVAYKRGNTQYIGWPDRLAEWAVNFQEGKGGWIAEGQLNDPDWRHMCHRYGIKEVPREYKHNPRPVIPEPFLTYVRANLDNWAENIYFKDLARALAKSRGL